MCRLISLVSELAEGAPHTCCISSPIEFRVLFETRETCST